MAGPYNIPTVSYNGDDPDPVEWANDFVKPAIDDLDIRAGVLEGTPSALSPVRASIVPPVGKYFPTVPAGNTGSNLTTNNAVKYAQRFLPTRDFTADRIGLEVITGGTAGALVRLGLFADADGTGWLPGARIVEWGTVDTTTNGIKELTISQAFEAGTVYWFAYSSEVATCVLRTVSNALMVAFADTQSEAAANSTLRFQADHAGVGAFPSTWAGTSHGGGGNVPAFILRRSA